MAVTDPEARIERLIARAEVEFGAAFTEMLSLVKGSISLSDLADLLDQSRFAEAFQIVARSSALLSVVWSGSYVRAGSETGSWLTANVADVVMVFDQTNFRAVQVMRNNGLRLVSSFTEQQRVATQQALIDGISRGVNPREMARAFRNSIGLTPNQERWVRNYERALQDLDAGALRRELRDRRFDPTVRRAIAQGDPLTKQQIDKMVARYRARALKLRAETIARTEALRSTHEGVREMYDQAIEAGELLPDQLIRIWNTAGDERVRDFGGGAQTSHRIMNNQQRLVGELFRSGAGNLTLDPGAFGVGSEDINCRCVVSTRILNLNELPSFTGVSVVTQGF